MLCYAELELSIVGLLGRRSDVGDGVSRACDVACKCGGWYVEHQELSRCGVECSASSDSRRAHVDSC